MVAMRWYLRYGLSYRSGATATIDTDGYRQVLAMAHRWPDRVWVVEGCSGIGKHLANGSSPTARPCGRTSGGQTLTSSAADPTPTVFGSVTIRTRHTNASPPRAARLT
jgi:hypothetical protein